MHPDFGRVEASRVEKPWGYELRWGITGRYAGKVLHVNAGQITPYVGGYDYFLEKTNALDDERAALTAG